MAQAIHGPMPMADFYLNQNPQWGEIEAALPSSMDDFTGLRFQGKITRASSNPSTCRWLSLTAGCEYANIDRIPASRVPYLLMGVAMSLCWYSEADESTPSLKVSLLLALDELLFEDFPRYGGLLSIWASAGAVWFLWLDYLCCIRHRC